MIIQVAQLVPNDSLAPGIFQKSVCTCRARAVQHQPVLTPLSVWEGHQKHDYEVLGSTGLRNSDLLQLTRLARRREKAMCFLACWILKIWPRNPCTTECLAFLSMCANVCHFCQPHSVFDPLLAAILWKETFLSSNTSMFHDLGHAKLYTFICLYSPVFTLWY